MSPNLLRWSALPIGLSAFVGRLAITFWLQPLTWRMSGVSGLLALLGGLAVAVGVPAGLFALLGRGGRPTQFTIRDGRFTVPPSPVYAGTQAIMSMFLGGGLVAAERVPDGDSMRIAEFALPASIIGVAVFCSVALAFLLVTRPQLHLDPDGLTVRRLRRTTRVTWEHLLPGGPPPPAKRRQRWLRLYLNAPPVVGRYPPSEDLPIGWLHVDPAFLAGAVRHYVEHPEDRAAIGSVDELARLRGRLASTPTVDNVT
ncbi:hypothetical protein [Micromonospora sp. SL4-19]|uniref:hypothetical protein n=1 Tax=Micromonospora sp. SL4-19 TaxID=3399129 RepID=UPI003A4DEDCE